MGQPPFSPSSKFGFKNPFQLFDLLENVSVSPPTNLGIGSVWATPPYPIKKSRYLSSAYWKLPLQALRLIIGRSSHPRVLGESFSMDFMELCIDRASDFGKLIHRPESVGVCAFFCRVCGVKSRVLNDSCIYKSDCSKAS